VLSILTAAIPFLVGSSEGLRQCVTTECLHASLNTKCLQSLIPAVNAFLPMLLKSAVNAFLPMLLKSSDLPLSIILGWPRGGSRPAGPRFLPILGMERFHFWKTARFLGAGRFYIFKKTRGAVPLSEDPLKTVLTLRTRGSFI
jgi:hypothetical protein